MNEVIVKKGQRTLNFVKVEKNRFSIIDTRANKQSLYKTVSRKKLMKTITEMI
ncbi:hypothetical protein ES703_44194 [subsurface metagenome]